MVYGIISASEDGWTDAGVLAAIVGGAVLIAIFVLWELRTGHPMVPMGFFRNPAFSGAVVTVLLMGFSLFGTVFILTLYLQNVLGYSPLGAGIRLLPMFTVAVGAPLGAAVTERLGRKITVPVGLAVVAGSLFIISTLDVSSETRLLWALGLLGLGLGTSLSSTVDVLLGSVPRERSGVGSAAQSTSLQLGGTLGVAVLGSSLFSAYGDSLRDSVSGLQIPPPAMSAITDSLTAAIQVADRLGGPAAGTARGVRQGGVRGRYGRGSANRRGARAYRRGSGRNYPTKRTARAASLRARANAGIFRGGPPGTGARRPRAGVSRPPRGEAGRAGA